MVTSDMCCPKCAGQVELDHNSFQCHACEMLWPLTEYWIAEATTPANHDNKPDIASAA